MKEKEGTATEFAEVTGDTSKGHGVFVETLANGDKAFVSYTFTGASKNKVMGSGSNKWTFNRWHRHTQGRQRQRHVHGQG